jgi:GNAT superfamily N-acetyltransferase
MLHGPIPLSRKIQRARFDSGSAPLDSWFCDHALASHRSGSTKVFVAHDDELAALGFYALSAGSVSPTDAPARVRTGMGGYPIPVALIARLAVASSAQGQRLGQALLKDALLRIEQASELLGVRAALAHAKHERARAFYGQFGFEESPIHPLWMYLLMKDLRRQLRP